MPEITITGTNDVVSGSGKIYQDLINSNLRCRLFYWWIENFNIRWYLYKFVNPTFTFSDQELKYIKRL